MAFPADPIDVEVSLALGADLADPGSWSWTDITSYVRENNRIRIRRGRSSERSTIPPSRCTLVVDNTDGRFCRLNPFGAWYGQIGKNTPIRVRVNNGSGYVTRFIGYVSGWPPSWDPSEQDQTVTLVADGILRRLGQGRVLRSALYRTMAGVAEGDYVPHGYWPMEDGDEATQFASGLANGGAAVYSGSVDHASSSDGLAGSDPLPTLGTGVAVTYPIAMYTDTGQWVLQFALNVPAALAAETVLFDARTPGGTVVRWELTLNPNLVFPPALDYRIKGYNAGGTAVIDDWMTAETDTEGFSFYGNWVMASLVVWQNGGDISARVSMASPTRDAGGVTDSVTGTAGPITALSTPTLGASLDGVGIGHVGVFVDAGFTPTVDDVSNAAAMDGWVGELAHERVERLCREERVPVTVTATESQAMGAQRNSTLIALLRECATTDAGLLYEPLDVGLVYVSSSERYNLTPAITLEYDQGHIAPPWDPTDDDLGARNDVTASRAGGGSARVTDEASIAAIGVYDDTVSVNTESDEQLEDVAGWALNVGTVDELRWPAVRPNLMKHPSLIDDWLTVDLGSQLHVTGHPSPLAPAEIKQLVEGYDETFGSYEFTVVANLAPASPWVVGVWDTARWAALWSRLELSVDDNDTSWSVETDADKLPWVDGNSSPQFPLEIEVGGLVYEVTEISGTSSPQTFTVTRLAQDKAHDAGTPVYVHEPLRWVLPSP